MLTKAGVATLFLAAVSVAVGRAFGLLELFVFGAAAACLVLAATASVWLARPSVAVVRIASPQRLHVGTDAKATLTITNPGRRKSGVISLTDTVSGAYTAEMMLAPIARGASASVSYRIPTADRGEVQLGPLVARVRDPYGVAQRRRRLLGISTAIVRPRILNLDGVPNQAGEDLSSTVARRSDVTRAGADFYALREYAIGDDLRKVHWPSTAKADQLMIRQDAMPSQQRTTIVVDQRRSTHNEATFELALSAAASLLVASWNRGDEVRVLFSDGEDTGWAHSRAAIEATLDHFATAKLIGGGTKHGLDANSAGGAVVAIGGRSPIAGEERARLTPRHGVLYTVWFHPSATAPVALAEQVVAGPGEVIVTGAVSFDAAWRQLHARRAPVGR